MMAFDRVVIALQYLDVSLEEFEHFLNNFSLSDKEDIAEKIQRAYLQNDIKELNNLSNTAKEQGYPVLSLAARCSITNLTETEIEQMTDFLYSTERWGYVELSVFYHAIDYIKPQEVSYLLDNFLLDGHDLLNVSKYRNKFLRVAYRSACVLSLKGYEELSYYILKRTEKHQLLHTMFNQNLKNFTWGYWDYCFKDSLEGDKQMRKAQEIFKELNPSEYTFYDQRYKMLKEGIKIR